MLVRCRQGLRRRDRRIERHPGVCQEPLELKCDCTRFAINTREKIGPGARFCVTCGSHAMSNALRMSFLMLKFLAVLPCKFLSTNLFLMFS